MAAAGYCHEQGINREVFPTYESYCLAFATELARLLANRGDPTNPDDLLSGVDSSKLHSSFKTDTHPRLAAAGYYEFVSQPQRA